MKAKDLSIGQHFVFEFNKEEGGIFRVTKKITEKGKIMILAEEVTLDKNAGKYPRISLQNMGFFDFCKVLPLRGIQSCIP